MRILMTNHSLQYIGGTEKWTHAMAAELLRRGHDVDVFTFMSGIASDHIEQLGARVVTEVPTGAYDLILANHNTCQAATAAVLGYRIYTSHGPRHPLEIPQPGAQAYVGVSAEVRAALAIRGITAQVITNGVDLMQFCPDRDRPDPDDHDPRVLAVCKNSGASALVAGACRGLGLELAGAHYLEHPVWDMAQLMRWADVVVGCGRSAIEALACGCSVYVMDARSEGSPQADGWLTAANVEHLRQCNFSTRAYGRARDQESIARDLATIPSAEWAREWAIINADIVTKARAYLDLYAGRQDETDETAEYERIERTDG